MIRHERIIWLQWVTPRSMFALANKNVLNSGTEPKRIGSAVTSVNLMISKGEEMRVLMPSILGADPLSSKLDWEQAVKNYWHGYSVDIPIGGRELDISWNIDILDPAKKDNIEELRKSTKKELKTDKELRDYLFSQGKDGKTVVPEEYLFRYATPANVEDYLLWRYCLVYRRVLNPDADPAILDRNPDIEFQLYDPNITRVASQKALKSRQLAMSAYLDVLSKADVKDNLLWVFGDNPAVLEEYDKDAKLEHYYLNQPNRFLEVYNDKNLNTKSTIERYISADLLYRLPGTGIVVDKEDTSVVLGNNINEVVAYFANPTNKEVVSRYATMYRANVAKEKSV